MAKLQWEFQKMQIEHLISLAEKEARVQVIIDLHKDDPKLYQFITKSLTLNFQLTYQKELEKHRGKKN